MATVTAAATIAGCGNDDDLSFTVNPNGVRAGETVELILSPAAEERVFATGVTYLQEQVGGGRWSTSYVLVAGYPETSTYDGQRPSAMRVTRDQLRLETGGLPVDVADEVVRIPRIEPGTYRLVKVLDRDDRSQGFGGPPTKYDPKLTATLQVVA